MLLPFTKAHGTGNHFIIIYLPDCPELQITDSLIQALCSTHTGIGADGVLVLSMIEEYDFKMDYYNNDGSWETMCANGARCAGLFLYKKNIINQKATFISGDGAHEIIINDSNNIALTIYPPEYTSKEIIIDDFSGFSINSGAKHFVIEVDITDNHDWESTGRKIRYSESFSPNGTNVNFVKKISQNTLEVITYEKGIESIMQSCGSGSVAAAYHMYKKHNLNNNLTIRVKGGKLLISSDNNWKKVWLQGEAKLLFTSTINTEIL